ncbi:MAG: histidinol dehydrogenase, partial [Clostridiales bacterium]|nr:histidinol dehydrogenase [Clostridiales bacterium]
MIRILKYGEMPLEEILFRGETSASREVEDTVAAILADVKENGDAAVKSYCLKFDGFAPEQLRVSEEEIEQAYASADSGFIKTLELARENIEAFHKRQLRTNFVINDRDGVVLGQKITPIQNVGFYVPGGTASYPSSLLMDSVPAVLAGCKRIVMVSPPGRDGKISAPILAAARVAGVTDIFKVGGAQAIGALACG